MARSRLFRSVQNFMALAAQAQAQPAPVAEFLEQKKSEARALSRRSFLAGSAAAAGLCGFSKLTPRASAQSRKNAPATGRVVIVGAGFAGLATAYALTKAGISCDLFEARRQHLGGRVLTAPWPGNSGLFCELGGELVDTGHESLRGLCQELGVELQTFSTADTGLCPEMFFLGGQLRSEKEVVDAFVPLAQVIAKDSATLTVNGELTSPTFDNTLGAEALDRTSLETYLQAQAGHVEPWLLNLIRQA